MGKFMKGHIGYKGMLGRKHTDESKLRMSISLKGRKFSEDHRRKISESEMGRKPWRY